MYICLGVIEGLLRYRGAIYGVCLGFLLWVIWGKKVKGPFWRYLLIPLGLAFLFIGFRVSGAGGGV